MKKLSRKARKIQTQKRLFKEAKLKALLPEINNCFKSMFEHYLESHLFGFNSGEDFSKCQFLITGYQMNNRKGNFLNNIGYVVQIREKCGAFGSDQVLLRHCDGNLIVHENQTFASLPKEFIPKVKKYFNKQLFKDDLLNDYEYGIDGKRIKGFRIPFKEENRSSIMHSFAITIGSKR